MSPHKLWTGAAHARHRSHGVARPATGGRIEFKWDGVRAMLDVTDGGVRLHSRAGNDITAGYPELVAQADGIEDALLDGEIVAFDEGRPSFERLQQRMHVRGKAEVRRLVKDVPVTYVVFDVLRRYGVDLTARPYTERRATLERFGAEHPDWTISPTFDDGAGHGGGGAGARPGGRGGQAARRPVPARARAATTGASCASSDPATSSSLGWEARRSHPATLSSLVLGNHHRRRAGATPARSAAG